MLKWIIRLREWWRIGNDEWWMRNVFGNFVAYKTQRFNGGQSSLSPLSLCFLWFCFSEVASQPFQVLRKQRCYSTEVRTLTILSTSTIRLGSELLSPYGSNHTVRWGKVNGNFWDHWTQRGPHNDIRISIFAEIFDFISWASIYTVR